MKDRIADCGRQGGSDLILMVYPGKKPVFSDRAGQLESLFSKAGLLK